MAAACSVICTFWNHLKPSEVTVGVLQRDMASRIKKDHEKSSDTDETSTLAHVFFLKNTTNYDRMVSTQAVRGYLLGPSGSPAA